MKLIGQINDTSFSSIYYFNYIYIYHFAPTRKKSSYLCIYITSDMLKDILLNHYNILYGDSM